MSFDLNSLDTLTASEAGAEMSILHPRTGLPILKPKADPNDPRPAQPYAIRLHGRNSTQYREAQRALNERRADMAARGIIRTADEFEQDDIDLLVACTKGWDLDQLDGQPFAFSHENARKLWSDRRFLSLRDRAVKFILDDANFLPA